jgi:NIMA-interacting peptidyl-prolyl cis-trans isomerase 1
MATEMSTSEEGWITKSLEKNPPPDSLPNGWVVRSSRSQPGTFYYFHQESGETRWEKPVQEKTNDVPQRAAEVKAATQAAATKHPVEAPAATTEPAAKKAKRSSGTDPKEVRVLHILKKHKGSRRPSSWRNPNITSTVDEAREELQGLVEVLQEVKDNPEEMRATFEELARTESDCSSAKRGGDLGFFGRKKMQPSFEQASFALNVGGLSEVIESGSGMHVILRLG